MPIDKKTLDTCLKALITQDKDSTTGNAVTNNTHPLWKCKQCEGIPRGCVDYRPIKNYEGSSYYIEVLEYIHQNECKYNEGRI